MAEGSHGWMDGWMDWNFIDPEGNCSNDVDNDHNQCTMQWTGNEFRPCAYSHQFPYQFFLFPLFGLVLPVLYISLGFLAVLHSLHSSSVLYSTFSSSSSSSHGSCSFWGYLVLLLACCLLPGSSGPSSFKVLPSCCYVLEKEENNPPPHPTTPTCGMRRDARQ